MSVSKVTIEDGCTICGLCEQICPDIFSMGETSAAVKEGANYTEFESTLREAAGSCPVNVIEIID